jgi:hypothetical protein
VPHHAAQLRICHERIGGIDGKGNRLMEAHDNSRWCDLGAFAWCFDCDHYVCALHYRSRHETHRTQLVTDEP